MSTETSEWLNRNVLIGMVSKRGMAWHYKKSDQGDEPNHYDGPVPVEDVRRRLFFWNAVELPIVYQDNVGNYRTIDHKKVIVRDDTYDVLGVPSAKYQPHPYNEWLVDDVATMLDDDIIIGSAGLLRGGAVAWVQIEMPENMKVADVEFRPNLLATTSFNSSIPTTYKRTVTVVVCDNTREMALQEDGAQVRIRHTANSNLRVAEARDALGIIFKMGEDFAREVEELLSIKVSSADFERFMNRLLPVHDDQTENKKTRDTTLRFQLRDLYANDPRVAPWNGTAYGVLQMMNTHRQHGRDARKGTIVVERTMMETLKGETGEADAKAMQLLRAVLN